MLDRCLIWDFDGTLALRDGAWTGSVCEVLRNARPDLAIDRERIRPLMRAGFPWHSPELVRAPCSADAWWEDLYPVLEAQRSPSIGFGALPQRAWIEAGLIDRDRLRIARGSRIRLGVER